MFGGSKAWFGSKSLWKPKNIHSFDYLKYLYGVLSKNAVVTEQNQQLLIEVWRLISEILIWGDQNDTKVFDFFLEKNMLTFYLSYIRQPSARFIIVQLLQTLNILFENTAQETSIYFLLSNNHVNDIITSQFDFVDEEVMAYYISFLKTLSLKLNSHTIHFFFNEHTRNFPLLTEALKFDTHAESMVRIAARTITLNVFRVRNRGVIRFVCDRVAPAQFSTFTYNISRQAVAMDACLSQAQALQLQHQQQHASGGGQLSGQQSISSLVRARERLQDYAAEHLDQLHYAADVLQLEIEELNGVVCPIVLSRLLLPVYLPSLLPSTSVAVDQLVENMPRISPLLSLFLLSHFFNVFKGHAPLLTKLLNIFANGDLATNSNIIRRLGRLSSKAPESLSDALSRNSSTDDESEKAQEADKTDFDAPRVDSLPDLNSSSNDIFVGIGTNKTDDEKLSEFTQSFGGRVYLNAVMHVLDSMNLSNNSSENNPPVACDRECVYALTLLLSIVNNTSLPPDLLTRLGLNSKTAPVKSEYNHFLIDKLINILSYSAKPDSKIRPVTVALASELLKSQVLDFHTPAPAAGDSVFSPSPTPSSPSNASNLSDHDLARLESAREESTLILRSFFKSEDTFVDAFEDEYNHFHDRRRVDIERILGDTNLLLSPAASTPLSGVDFSHRLPCGEVERSRLAMRVFFTLRSLSLQLRGESETQLPLFKFDNLVHPGDALDLNNSDLLACSVTVSSDKTERLFLVLERDQLILVRPDALRMGWGIVRLAGPLYDVELTIDKDDGRGLHVTLHPLTVHSSSSGRKSLSRDESSVSSSLGSVSGTLSYSRSLVSARFQFDDHIRCRAARERIVRGRQRVRLAKMQRVANLLEIPPEATNYVGSSGASGDSPLVSTPVPSVLSMFNPKIQQAIMAASASTPLSSRAPYLPNSISTPIFANDVSSLSSGKLTTSSSMEQQQQQLLTASLNATPLSIVQSSMPVLSEDQRIRSAAVTDSRLTVVTDHNQTNQSMNQSSSSSSSVSDIPGVLDADQHRRRFMQSLGLVSGAPSPTSTAVTTSSPVVTTIVPPIPPRLHEQVALAAKTAETAPVTTTMKEPDEERVETAVVEEPKPQQQQLLIAFDESPTAAVPPLSVEGVNNPIVDLEEEPSDDTLRKAIEEMAGESTSSVIDTMAASSGLADVLQLAVELQPDQSTMDTEPTTVKPVEEEQENRTAASQPGDLV